MPKKNNTTIKYKKAKPQKPAKINKRPPVVVVLGHVDHGKTTLLDTIRNANVAGGETGGITQHIGAYQVKTKENDDSSWITFIDTPGHQAFSKMRSRGAQVADLAILVVAANDGVKPQTREAIAHIKQSNIPFIVAINKIDVDGVNLDVVKSQLAEQEVYVEGYGGDIVTVPISALKKKGIDDLLEMIHLVYDLKEEDQDLSHFKAFILESYIDPHRGVVSNLLIRSGELKVGDIIFAEEVEAKVRSLLNDRGAFIDKAGISQPVQMLGFKHQVPVGSQLIKEKSSTKVASQSEESAQAVNADATTSEETPRLKLILKTDVAGTLEAIKASLTEEVELVGEGVGDVSESDVLLARSTKARLVGFRVKVSTTVKKLAEMEEIKIETFDVIYHLLEDLEKRVLKLMEPTINEEVLGKAEVIAEFNIKGNHIAGCKIIEGTIVRSQKIRVIRGERTVAEPRIGAMQHERKEVTEVKEGNEVALVFRPDIKFKVGDQIISYKVVED